MPQRIQLSRAKGWRKPEGAIVVSRPSRWGNPAAIGLWVSVGPAWREARRCTTSTVIRTNADAVLYYRLGLRNGGMVVEGSDGVRRPVALPTPSDIRQHLRGRDLACWCRIGEPCHADELLAIAQDAP